MKMSRTECIKMYDIIIAHNGRPRTEDFLCFGEEKAHEISRELILGRCAALSREALLNAAIKARAKMLNA